MASGKEKMNSAEEKMASGEGVLKIKFLAVATAMENKDSTTRQIRYSALAIPERDRNRQEFVNTPCPPVHAAIMNGRIDVAEKLIKDLKFKPDALWTSKSKGFKNVSPAFIAVCQKDLKAFKTLLNTEVYWDADQSWDYEGSYQNSSGTILELIEKIEEKELKNQFMEALMAKTAGVGIKKRRWFTILLQCVSRN